MPKTAILHAVAHHVPEKVLTNKDFETMVDTSDEWIVTRTGIKERRIADGQTLTDLALPASQKALELAGMEPEDLTHILVGTFSADAYIPSGAAVLQHRLGLSGRMAMDISAACSGFLYTVETARALTLLHPDARILTVAGDVVSSRTDYTDRATCVLFGDACGAAVVTADNASGQGPVPTGSARVRDILLAADGSLGDLLTIRGGASGAVYKRGDTIRDDFFVQMQGRDVYKHAVRSMVSICKQVLEENGLTLADVDVLLPHQANLRIIEAVGDRLGFEKDRVFVNVDRYGNTSAASVPLALSEARETGFIEPGMRVLVTTFGGGFTWGAALLEY